MKLIVAYLVFIHLVLGVLIIKTTERRSSPNEQYINTKREILKSVDRDKPTHSIVFLGDSLTEALPTFIFNGVNYGIGYSTTKDINDRLGDYDWSGVDTLVFMIGTNDALAGKEPEHLNFGNVRALWYAAPLMENRNVEQLNNQFAQDCRVMPRCKFINLNPQLNGHHTADGVHLNADGYRIWIDSLKSELK
jgi:lysophospholipase L1-like esterase